MNRSRSIEVSDTLTYTAEGQRLLEGQEARRIQRRILAIGFGREHVRAWRFETGKSSDEPHSKRKEQRNAVHVL
jgi:hypothetical protein